MSAKISLLLRAARMTQHSTRGLNCWTAAITKKHRNIYERTYPTTMVLPDGSSVNMQYHEPRKIITLPVDLTTLSDSERKIRLERRKPKSKVKIAQEIDVDFDESRYIKLPQKK